MHTITIPEEVFRTVAAVMPAQVRRPRHREPWSPAERRLEAAMPPPQGRRVARPVDQLAAEVRR